MSVQDLRIAFFNAISLGVSFTHVENSSKDYSIVSFYCIYVSENIRNTQEKVK